MLLCVENGVWLCIRDSLMLLLFLSCMMSHFAWLIHCCCMFFLEHLASFCSLSFGGEMAFCRCCLNGVWFLVVVRCLPEEPLLSVSTVWICLCVGNYDKVSCSAFHIIFYFFFRSFGLFKFYRNSCILTEHLVLEAISCFRKFELRGYIYIDIYILLVLIAHIAKNLVPSEICIAWFLVSRPLRRWPFLYSFIKLDI
ncbi:hypothetical protein O6H91_06G009800 [Diphasiastrum complanatum]|uniref:Uncharacterized protein n=1 Tax=Diphasiastrum complanatum TaxID=34168 RepID=A0ACC2DAI6_DIPCM|nr:hypothetical protein O6H91_06G009800 [Diphasiastrum complanatum]